MKKIVALLAVFALLLCASALAENASVLTQEQYDQMDAWFAQVEETIPGSANDPTISGNKFIVALKEPGKGVYTSLPDDGLSLDMSAFPQEHLAASYEEADTLIMIYPVYKVTGQYLGMMIPISARKTYTTVCAVDLVSGAVGTPVSAVVKNAPSSVQIKTQNGIPMQNAVSGPFEAQEALEKIVEWLKIQDVQEVLLTLPEKEESPNAETGDEARYREACDLFDQELYYSASIAFRESQYGDWQERAVACVQPWPENGEVWRNYRIPVVGMQLTIQVNQPEDSSFFARIYLDGKAYTGLLIRGTDAVTVDLPGGTYAIKAGTGDVWYGGREAFGKDGHYQAMTFDNAGSETTKLELGYSYTLSINVDKVQGTGVGNRNESWENFAE